MKPGKQVIFVILLATGCVSTTPYYPKKFAATANRKQLKMILEWGSLLRIEGGPVLIDKTNNEWTKGKVSNSGLKVGPFGSSSSDDTHVYNFRVSHPSGLNAQTDCELSIKTSSKSIGNVGAEAEDRRISCITKERNVSYNLQLTAKKGTNYAGSLVGNGISLQVKPNMLNDDGQELGSAGAWDIFQNDALIASLGRGYEPTFLYVNNDRTILLLTAVIVGAIKVVPY